MPFNKQYRALHSIHYNNALINNYCHIANIPSIYIIVNNPIKFLLLNKFLIPKISSRFLEYSKTLKLLILFLLLV